MLKHERSHLRRIVQIQQRQPGFQRRVTGAQMHIFEQSAHSTYRTETDEYVRIVRQFVEQAEAKDRP